MVSIFKNTFGKVKLKYPVLKLAFFNATMNKKNYFPFLAFFLLYLIVISTQPTTSNTYGRIMIADKQLIKTSFKGEVIGVDFGRGLKVKIKNYKRFLYNPSSYCNSYTCLGEVLEIGDTLFKNKNSDTIFQIKKSNHKIYTWVLTNK